MASPASTASPAFSSSETYTMEDFVQFLRKHKMEQAEALLKQELTVAKKTSIKSENSPEDSKPLSSATTGSGPGEATTSNVLSSYSSEGNPGYYEEVYQELVNFVDNSLDLYRHELALILYPVFVHMYLELVYNGHEKRASQFVARFGRLQESFFSGDIRNLSYITKRAHMSGSELMENFQTSQFTVRMSRDTYSQLRQLRKIIGDERKHQILWNIIQEHLYLDVYEGIARNKRQIDATSGGMIGEANRQANRAKVYYGLQKEPDLSAFLVADEEEEVAGPGEDKPKKKKKKDILALKKQKSDPHAPPPSRMPFPDLRDVDKIEKVKILKEAQKRQLLGPGSLPSVCMYTIVNAGASVTSAEISDDSSMLALGFANAHIKVFSLLSSKLKAMKSAERLAEIDNDADDVLHRMIDETSAEGSKSLLGHASVVFGLSFSPDRSLLLSCSEDGTVRLWSLQTWTCVVVYKGHLMPVWAVAFCPQGHYFASCGQDKTARLWVTENSTCVRVFAGHFSGVDCLTFHPNSNYLATGSSDRCVRLWDCVTGLCVRLMTGHKDAVACLAFSADGRFLASGGSDSRVLLWDIAHGHLLGDFSCSLSANDSCGLVTSLCFSRDNAILTASSSADCVGSDQSVAGAIILWDFAKFVGELNLEEVNVTHNPNVNSNSSAYRIASFGTKDSSVVGMQYTRRNLLVSVGSFQ